MRAGPASAIDTLGEALDRSVDTRVHAFLYI